MPSLSESLTLNKADFLRSGPRGLFYLTVRKAVQQSVMAQLQIWGEGQDPEERARRRATRPLERDLEQVLVRLADDFPALAPLVEQRPGGQKALPVGTGGGKSPFIAAPGPDELGSARATGTPQTGDSPSEPTADAAGEPPTRERTAIESLAPRPGKVGAKQPRRYRLSIQFEERADLPGLARLIESVVWINTAHPAHRRAVASRFEGYHAALGVAMALAPEVAEPGHAAEFMNAFLARWGEALSRDGRRRGAKKR